MALESSDNFDADRLGRNRVFAVGVEATMVVGKGEHIAVTNYDCIVPHSDWFICGSCRRLNWGRFGPDKSYAPIFEDRQALLDALTRVGILATTDLGFHGLTQSTTMYHDSRRNSGFNIKYF
tara:strand:+ start:1636 stop:2001 length:366 start_codon:yes stop_codon:yes gene_type:complete